MEEEIELRQYWEMLRKRWIIVVVIPLLAALTSGIISFFVIKPVYQASTTLIVGKNNSESSLAEGQMLDLGVIQTTQQFAATYGMIIKSRTVEENVLKNIDSQLTVAGLHKLISVSSVKNTGVIAITVTDSNPERASVIANTLVQEFSKVINEIKKTDSVNVLDKAVTPTSPVKPNKKNNILIAFVVGLIASIVLVFLLEYLDNTIKTSSDVEKLLGIPVLGVIPNYDIGKQG